MKKALICLSILVILMCCVPNVVAAPTNKFTPDIHSNYTWDFKGRQQTYILATLDDKTTAITGVGQSISLSGVLSYDIPPTNSTDSSHGIPNATLNIQSLNSDGKTWITVATTSTD